MAKWYGKVGYAITSETTPGVWKANLVWKEYTGDFTRNHKRWESSQGVNENITLQSEISLVCDPYALQNFQFIRCVEFMDTLWKVTAVDVQYPRLNLSIGGVYNGEQD